MIALYILMVFIVVFAHVLQALWTYKHVTRYANDDKPTFSQLAESNQIALDKHNQDKSIKRRDHRLSNNQLQFKIRKKGN